MADLADYPTIIQYKPDASGFKVLEAFRPPMHTEFEDGPDLMRDAVIGNRARMAYRLMFRRMQDYGIFRDFTEWTLKKASMRFNMPVFVPFSNTYEPRVVQIERGLIQAEPWGMGMQVSFTLIVYNW